MNTLSRVVKRISAFSLIVTLLLSMLPGGFLGVYAAPENSTDSYTITTITFKDKYGNLLDGVKVDYSVSVDGKTYPKNSVTSGKNGIVVIEETDLPDISFTDSDVRLNADISKLGYDKYQINNERITKKYGNMFINLKEKSKKSVQIKIDDNNSNPMQDVNVSVSGYSSASGKTNEKGIYECSFYSGEYYNIEVSKDGYITVSDSNIFVDDNTDSFSFQLVQKLEDKTFDFDLKKPDNIKYGDGFVNEAKSGIEGRGTVKYSVAKGDSVSVDPYTGELTTKKAGSSTIKAIIPEDDCYKESVTTYDITVDLCPDTGFGFEVPNPLERKYKEKDTFTNRATGGNGTGKITYKLKDNGDVATIDEETGELTILKSGEVEVTATRESDGRYTQASASYCLTIKRADQDEFYFTERYPQDVLITSGTYKNEATGGSGNGAIIYKIIEGGEFAEIKDEANPEVTLLKVGGPVTVEAIKEKDSRYEEAIARYTFNIVKAEQENFHFENATIEKTYEPDLTISNKLNGGNGEGAIEYKIVTQAGLVTETDTAAIDPLTGVVSILGATDAEGIVIKATKFSDDKYNETSTEYTIIVNKAQQTGLKFKDGDKVTKTWSETDNTYVNTLIGGQSEGDIEYSIEGSPSEMPYGGSCASLDESGVVTMYGLGQITVKAIKKGDNNYLDSEPLYYSLIINRAAQEALEFALTVPVKVTYNDNDNIIALATDGGSGDGAVTYSVVEGDVVYIEGDKAIVTKSGDVTIKAIKAATNCYEEAEKTINITIEKAEQHIKFEDVYTTSVVYGRGFKNSAYEVQNTEVPDKKGYADGTRIVYSIVSGGNIADVDSEGKLLFKNNAVGTLIVKAFKSGNDCYKDTYVEYTLDVVFADIPENPYTISGDKKNESGWYTDSVTITPTEGYLISYSNDLYNNEWSKNLIISTEGYNGKTIYLKYNDDITGEIIISPNDIRLDRTSPEEMSISYSESVLDTILGTISFGFYRNPVTVTLEAKDDISHIASFAYTYGDTNGVIEADDIQYSEDDTKATATLTIAPQYRGTVSFTAFDTAGNKADKYDEKVIVVDNITPYISVGFDNNDASNGTYYSADRMATITVNESNFFTEAFGTERIDEHLLISVRKTTDDGKESVTEYKNEDLTSPFTEVDGTPGIWEAKLLFNENADYTFTIEYRDFSGNEAVKYETSFTIDKIKPIINISYDNNEAENEYCYKNKRVAEFTVIEHNFNPSDIVLESMTAVDIQGSDVDLNSDYQEILKSGAWKNDGDVHTIELVFDTDARYDFNITYSDLAGNSQEQPVEDSFVVDKTMPENLSVTYEKSVLDIVIETVTFGFYSAPLTVTIIADDMTSGVDFFTYSYGVSVGESSINIGRDDTVIKSDDILYSNDGKTAMATFEIAPQFRGGVSFTATDKAGNESTRFKDEKVVVVDNIAPGVAVGYNLNEDDASNGIFFNKNRTAVITVNEANFFTESFEKAEDTGKDTAELINEHLSITVNKVKNDGSRVTEVIKNSDLTTPFTKTSEDIWTATLLFDEDADYSWEIKYKDFSGNAATDFSDSFTIDKIKPVVKIEYDENEALNGDYYDTERTATLTVTEHNFRSGDMSLNYMSAVDIQGNSVDYGKNYDDLLKNGKWTDNGDIHKLVLPFDIDARYSFEIGYTDMAGNSAESAVGDEFCIDRVEPSVENMKVSYSTSVVDIILETVTFGFYKAPVTVTLSAEDSTSGIDFFTYSYSVANGESTKNKGKSDIVISNSDIVYSNKGKNAASSFLIPPQFRGNVKFTATDRSGNKSQLYSDKKTIVVDNTIPGLEVTYDNNSARYKTYYNSARTARITIKEANFFTRAFEDNYDINTSSIINKCLVIKVTSQYNDGTKKTKILKNSDLTTPFKKISEDTWQASLLFAEDADYTWSIEYKDFSDNRAGKFSDSFTVDNIDPVIEVKHYNNDVKNGRYFNKNRNADIIITEHNFKPEDVAVTVTSAKETGKVRDYQKLLKNPKNWETVGDVHTAKIVFDTEADYTFNINYKDMAGRNNSSVKYGGAVAPKKFTIDKTAPVEADIIISGKSVLARGGVAFEKFYRTAVDVRYKVNCDISGLDNIKYQKVDSVSAYSENGAWTAFNNKVTVTPDEKFVIYFRAEDKAGNITIVNSTGIVVDSNAPVGEIYAPRIDIIPEKANSRGFHNSDVKVAVNVIDPKYSGEIKDNNGYYSGLSKITYRIYTKDTNATETGVLFDPESGVTNGEVVDKDRLVKEWNGSILISSRKFNSNNIIVEIFAVDNAGNERIANNEMINKPIKIDITAPTISVSYNNNNGDTTFADGTTGAFYKTNRTARIEITERNFNPDDVRVDIHNTDGVVPVLSGWTSYGGSGNGDNITHTATITYSADGDYTFGIESVDSAENKNTSVNYNNSQAPTKFTIDKTAPKFSVSYDNNDSRNGNYYRAERTALLTVVEHNFEESRVRLSLSATDNGVKSDVPIVSRWTTTGDTHTATIVYKNDSYYTFDFAYTDKAGNNLPDFKAQGFFIDKTNPKVSISKITDESANNDSGNIGYTITATDTNPDIFSPVLTAVIKTENGFETKELDVGSLSEINNGMVYEVDNLNSDGIYRITCTVIDKAGNEYSEVTLSHEDGSDYVEKRSGNETLVTFSVNRNGSAFEIDKNTSELVDKYYVQRVENDIVIVEVNADPLKEYKITVNGKELNSSDYTVDEQCGREGDWNRYTYKIKSGLFAEEGEYNVVVSSRDKATNDAFSDVKDAGIKFVVDRTAPVVTVTGLSDGGRYQTERQAVNLVPTDDGGALKSIVVSLVDNNGNELGKILDLSGDELSTALEEGNSTLSFYVEEGLYQNIRIVCDDEADSGSENNIIFDQTIRNVSVTSSPFLIFWANEPLRWATIGGIGIVIAGIVFLVIFKKRKKDVADK